jgi:hypothetical protein
MAIYPHTRAHSLIYICEDMKAAAAGEVGWGKETFERQ